jgi:hypothetical protein
MLKHGGACLSTYFQQLLTAHITRLTAWQSTRLSEWHGTSAEELSSEFACNSCLTMLQCVIVWSGKSLEQGLTTTLDKGLRSCLGCHHIESTYVLRSQHDVRSPHHLPSSAWHFNMRVTTLRARAPAVFTQTGVKFKEHRDVPRACERICSTSCRHTQSSLA